MAATEIDVKYVAHLARLALSPEEEKKLGAQLGQILGYIEKLNQLDNARAYLEKAAAVYREILDKNPRYTAARHLLGICQLQMGLMAEGIASLETAFSNRLGEVDSFPGHLGLQVWRDNQKPGRYLMVTWWETEDAFRGYMQSDSHKCSHARIPSEPARPKAVRVSRFSLVTE